MHFRTIQKTADSGGLNRELVRQAVIRVRNRRLAAAAPTRRLLGGAMVAREVPLVPYGTPAAEASADGGG